MSGPPIVQPGVLDVIQTHVNSAWAKRVGGILLGRPVDDAVRVEGALPARQTEEYAGEIAFPASVWVEAYAALDQYPGARIVGWYHSHPGGGVALSDYDRRLHTALFGEPTNVALVLDPVAEKLAWFGWTITELPPAAEGVTAKPMGFAAQKAQGRGRRAAIAGLVALGVAAGGAGGYWLSGWRGDHRPARAALVRLAQAQQAQFERLRQALRQARQELEQEQGTVRQMQDDLDAAKKALREARKELREARRQTTFVVNYEVRPGDSLWDLAARFYGDPLRWTQIFDANRGRITDPDHLAIGQVLDVVLGK